MKRDVSYPQFYYRTIMCFSVACLVNDKILTSHVCRLLESENVQD